MSKQKTCKKCSAKVYREPYFGTSYNMLKFIFGHSIGYYTCHNCGWSAILLRKFNVVLKTVHKPKISFFNK